MLLAGEETGLKKSSQGKITTMSFCSSFDRELCLQHTVVIFCAQMSDGYYFFTGLFTPLQQNLFQHINSYQASFHCIQLLICLAQDIFTFCFSQCLNSKINVNRGRVSSAGRLLVCRAGCDGSDPGNQT